MRDRADSPPPLPTAPTTTTIHTGTSHSSNFTNNQATMHRRVGMQLLLVLGLAATAFAQQVSKAPPWAWSVWTGPS
jgi:hypothetical protein